MGDFKIGSLILAALFGLPGYIFILILTKFSFKTSRQNSGKTVLLFAAFVFSTVLALIFDSEDIRHALLRLFSAQTSPYDVPTEFQYLFAQTKFSRELLGSLFHNEPPSNIGFLAIHYLACLTAFAIGCAVLLSVALNFIGWYSKKTFDTYFVGTLHFLGYVSNKASRLLVSKKDRAEKLRAKLGIAASQSAQPKQGWFKRSVVGLWSFVKGLGLVVFIVAVILFVLVVVVLFGLASLLDFIFEVILYIYHRAMSLFQHPGEAIFEPLAFGERSGLPIVEVLGKNEKINKGLFVSFLPKNSEEVGSITLRNVIQYTKEDQKEFFDRDSRKVYEFPNRKSLLTITSDSIYDMNVSFLRYQDFSWNFKITGPTSIINQRWYLRLILEKHKCLFDFKKFNAWVDSRYAPHFFLDLLKLIDEHYSKFFYVYKLRSLTYELLHIWRQYEKDLKTKMPTMTVDEQEDVKKAKAAFARYLWRMRSRFRNLR